MLLKWASNMGNLGSNKVIHPQCSKYVRSVDTQFFKTVCSLDTEPDAQAVHVLVSVVQYEPGK